MRVSSGLTVFFSSVFWPNVSVCVCFVFDNMLTYQRVNETMTQHTDEWWIHSSEQNKSHGWWHVSTMFDVMTGKKLLVFCIFSHGNVIEREVQVLIRIK